MPNLTILNCPVSQGMSKFTAPLQRSWHKLPILHTESEALKAAGRSDMIWHYSTQSPCKTHGTEHVRRDLFPTYSLTGPKTAAWKLQGMWMAADRNSIQLRDGQTHPEEPWCIFHDLLWHGVLNTMLMDEHNHSDSNDSEESSKVLLKWYILHIHHYQRINFIVKNRVQQAVVPCIFLSITAAPASLLWNLNWDLQQDKKNSQVLCALRTQGNVRKPHIQEKFVCKNLEKVSFETMTCLISSFWQHFHSFHCDQVWKWAKHIFMSRSSRWKARRAVPQTQAQLIPSLQATGQGCLCISI